MYARRVGLGVSLLSSTTLLSRRGATFSPASLFATGEQGAWYDPSDLSTLFQDSAGTTPVTAPDQTVALLLDKAQNTNFPARFFPAGWIPYGSNMTAIDAGLAINASIANAGEYFVRPSNGSDANPGTFAQPFATVARAMRTATGAATRVRMLEDCVIPPFDLRNTDASQTTQQFKWLDANGFNVTIRVTGPALSTQTFVQDGTNTNCWGTTLSVGAAQTVTRVLNVAVPDDYGYDTPLRLFTSLALLNAATEPGYFWDDTGKVLWLNIGGDVESAKADYRALYTDAAGTSRIYVQGAALGLSGLRMEGVQILQLDGGGRRPEIYADNCTQLWPNDKGNDFRGWFICTNHLCYASRFDGANGFTTWAGGRSFIQTVRSRFIRSGDRRTFALDQTLQGVSAHGGCDHISFESQFIQNNGQGVADTCANSQTDYSWIKNCTIRGGATGVVAANLEFGSTATSAARFAFVEGVNFTNTPSNGDLRVSANATVQRFGAIQGTVVGTVLPYGNHATQSNAAQRPTYGIVPAGGRRNLLLNTTTLSTQSVTVAAGSHTLSFTGTGTVTLTGAAIGALVGIGVSDRVSLTFTATAGSLTLTVVGSVTLAQLEVGSTATNYQRVGTAFDVTEAGVASMSYLSFDGTDDGMLTGNIVPGTDKAQVFAGLRKLSDAAIGMVAETSLNAGGGSAIQLRAPGSVAGNYIFGSAGTLVSTVVANGFAAPITNVVTGLGDIAADVAIIRINGTQAAQSTLDQGTGNYLTYPLYIGRRGGTSLPYNGQIYGLILRFGANLDAATITQTETWLANRVAPTVVI
jgi:hypothetical protein